VYDSIIFLCLQTPEVYLKTKHNLTYMMGQKIEL